MDLGRGREDEGTTTTDLVDCYCLANLLRVVSLTNNTGRCVYSGSFVEISVSQAF
jgi:hypothetical protein